MTTLKVVCDTNIYVAYLLSPESAGTEIDRLLMAASRKEFELLLPVEVIIELNTVTRARPRIARRIDQGMIETLLRHLVRFATVLPQLDDEPPPICRDPDDDFLIATSVINGVDCLVTRDLDLLALSQLGTLHIIDPVDFLRLLGESSGSA